jgi:hypothetical protein
MARAAPKCPHKNSGQRTLASLLSPALLLFQSISLLARFASLRPPWIRRAHRARRSSHSVLLFTARGWTRTGAPPRRQWAHHGWVAPRPPRLERGRRAPCHLRLGVTAGIVARHLHQLPLLVADGCWCRHRPAGSRGYGSRR